MNNNNLKIAISTICLNEEKFAERFMNAHKGVDGIFILDTGSTDRTVEILRDHGATVKIGKTVQWRFDIPRNAALCMVPTDYDIVVSVDLDEMFKPGWLEGIRSAWTPQTTRLRYNYTWNFNPDGSPGTTFLYDKIVDRKNYRWVLPIHEVLVYSSPVGQEVQTIANDVHLEHHADQTKSRSSYLPLLEMAYGEQPNDDRTAHYYGRELMFYGNYDKAIKVLKGHLDMPSAQWKSERCSSMRFIARCYQAKGDLKEAESWLLKACAEVPTEREPWSELANNYYAQRNFAGVYYAAKNALAIVTPPNSYIQEPAAWNFQIYDLAALGAWNIGLKDEGLQLATRALSMNPSDVRLQNNVRLMAPKI